VRTDLEASEGRRSATGSWQLLNALLNPLWNCVQQRGALAAAPLRALGQSPVTDFPPPTNTTNGEGGKSVTASWKASRGRGGQGANRQQHLKNQHPGTPNSEPEPQSKHGNRWRRAGRDDCVVETRLGHGDLVDAGDAR
jgi:hypothetical protein